MKKPIPFGKYYLLERINVGGMAEVFRAKAFGVEGFERLVAVKRILPNIAEDKDFVRMFIDEAKIAVQLNHANIAQIFDLGVVENDYYIALEHVHGRDLRSIFNRCRHRGGEGDEPGEPMPIAQSCFILMKVCEGLDYAHNKRDQTGRELNLVHRDVSPQNVLVSFEGEVKIIDFGIAKAAGKGSKTQAGILKGKFGYMSPEQVRGLPVDRRSDVFSCGIVLYELLTGERLFVGESDFSTLEKVRNVEILPPSTYNRRIPDELERIVLKALAKDTEERYQSAIDLHDELQAFVYTAGEFYSRKDLAGWMKATFAAEIEAETAKLESYRHMTAPEGRGAHVASLPTGPSAVPSAPSGRRSTLAMASVVPPPASPAPFRVVGNGRRSAQLPVQAAAGPGVAPAAALVPPVGAQPGEWDDAEDLETAIYTEPGELGGPPASPPAAASLAAAPAGGEQERASLAATARSWPPPVGLPARARNGAQAGKEHALASGSSAPAPLSSSVHDMPTLNQKRQHVPAAPLPGEDPPAVVELAALARALPEQVDRDTSSLAFGRSFLRAHGHGKKKWLMPGLWPRLRELRSELRPSTLIQMAATAVVGVVIAILVYVVTSGGASGRQGDRRKAAASAARAPAASSAARPSSTAAPAPAPLAVDPASGFDLIVDPAGAVVKLDGRSIGKAPLQIRNLVEGHHLVEVEGVPGFFGKSQTVQVTLGQAQRVVLKLDAMQVVGRFVSEPPGARVTLIVNGERRPLGFAPVEVALDPREHYQALFRRPGFAPEVRPVAMNGAARVDVVAVLARALPGRPVPQPELVEGEAEPAAAKRTGAAEDAPAPAPADEQQRTVEGEGTLGIMSKPPCRIFIDGRDTGQKTPVVGIQVKAGRHRVTLINNEFGLKESFFVEIQPGEAVKAIKDLTDRLPTANE
ncbi:MAG TPA: serine/threonine-protein kinase [Candidatus Acidoferrum sp.]|nr:serine/threonine-protein kinase [Candidatus Acidoferrum sp.]